MVYYDFSAIGKIAELRLPEHQSLGVGHGIAIFEAQHPIFGEGTVQHFKPAMRHGGKRDIFIFGVLIDPDAVPLAERTAARILSSTAHAIAFREQPAKDKDRQRNG